MEQPSFSLKELESLEKELSTTYSGSSQAQSKRSRWKTLIRELTTLSVDIAIATFIGCVATAAHFMRFVHSDKIFHILKGYITGVASKLFYKKYLQKIFRFGEKLKKYLPALVSFAGATMLGWLYEVKDYILGGVAEAGDACADMMGGTGSALIAYIEERRREEKKYDNILK
jgi:hypothetical protein